MHWIGKSVQDNKRQTQHKMDEGDVAESDKTPLLGTGCQSVATVEGRKQHPWGCRQTGGILDQQLPAWKNEDVLSDGNSKDRWGFVF